MTRSRHDEASVEIDALAEKAKRLPEERQLAVVAALREMLDEPYVLSAEELSILAPALADIQAGTALLTDADSDDMLHTRWS
ncbi:MAG: hypothetical protein HC888_15515 [Candidatus Competibacteraceae bacterium]|nr:hypothetical protein [Candidatus Competibacteraceae bacterium]NJO56452.1 hypothetical protein [Rhodospirillales bacterium]